MANVKVQDSTRDRLVELAGKHPRGKLSLDQTINGLIDEHLQNQEARARRLEQDEQFMARIDAARREPLEAGGSTEDVLAELASRSRAKSA